MSKDISSKTIEQWLDECVRTVDGEYSQHAQGYREALRHIRDRMARHGQIAPEPKPKRAYTVTDKCRANWKKRSTKEPADA